MKLIRSIGARFVAVALAFAVVPAAVPSGTPVIGVSKAEAQYRYYGHRGGYYGGPGRYYGGHRHYYRGGRGYYNGRRYYGGRRYYRHHSNAGAAVAAGIIGLGVGAAIANSARPRSYGRPVYRGAGLSAHDRYCLAKYRSYDVYSKTYQPYHGPRRLCR